MSKKITNLAALWNAENEANVELWERMYFFYCFETVETAAPSEGKGCAADTGLVMDEAKRFAGRQPLGAFRTVRQPLLVSYWRGSLFRRTSASFHRLRDQSWKKSFS